MSGHVQSIRSTLEKKQATTTTGGGIGGEAITKQKQQMGVKQEMTTVLHNSSLSSNKLSSNEFRGVKQQGVQPSNTNNRFVPNRNSPTWKSVQQKQQQQFFSTKQKQTYGGNTNGRLRLMQTQAPQLSPTPTVSSTTAVVAPPMASRRGSNNSHDDDNDAGRLFSTTINLGDDVREEEEEEEVRRPNNTRDSVVSINEQFAKIDLGMNDRVVVDDYDYDDEEKHLTSLPSPPLSSPPHPLPTTPSPSSSSTTCSSVNWEVLEKLLGGGGGGSSMDADVGYGEEVINGEDGRSKIRLLAELVGSKSHSTPTPAHRGGVEANNEGDKENTRGGKYHAMKETRQKMTMTTTTKMSRGSDASTQTQTKEEKQHHHHREDSLIGSYVNRNDKAAAAMMTTPKSMMDIVAIETAPSSITTASSSNKFQQRQHHKKGGNNSNNVRSTTIAVEESATSFSPSSYSSSSLVYSLGETIQSMEQQQHHFQQQHRIHPTSANIAVAPAGATNVVASLDASTMQHHHLPMRQSAVNQQNKYVSIEVPVVLNCNVNNTNKNDDLLVVDKNDSTVKNDEVADVLASTLAECRLLLEMSPPPTPIMYRHGNNKMFSSKDENKHIPPVRNEEEPPPQLSATTKLLTGANLLMQSLKSQPRPSYEEDEKEVGEVEDVDTGKDEEKDNTGEDKQEKGLEKNKELPEEAEEKVDTEEDTEVVVEEEWHRSTDENEEIEGGNSIAKDSYISPTSFTEFLICPACSEEFTEEDEGAHQPLHSFACDHIICRGCVYNAFSHADDVDTPMSTSTMVFCPECGQDGAFDIRRPIVSRAYLNLVRKMKSTGRSISSKDASRGYSNTGEADLNSQPNDKQEQQHHQKVGEGRTVPSQISVPSPRSKKDRSHNHGSRSMHENPAKEHCESHDKSETTVNLTVIVPTPTNSNVVNHSTDLNPDDVTSTNILSTIATPTLPSKFPLSHHPQQPHQDPSTPISRAQFHVVQRREKLAQSLEKVNMILERSKALTVPETPKEEQEEDFMTMSKDFPSNQIDESDSNKAFEWDKDAFHTATSSSGVKSRCKAELRIDTGRDEFSTSCWSSPPSFGQVEVADGNAVNYDGITSSMNEPPVIMDHRLLAFPLEQPIQVPSTSEGGNETVDIFRAEIDQAVGDTNTHTTSELIEFGCTNNLFSRSASSESSTTESKDETLSLLAENRAMQPSSADEQGTKVLKSSKFKAYCFNHIIKSGGGAAAAVASSLTTTLSEDHGSISDDNEQERSCPQFLPSLNYSMMNESDEYAGLVGAETPRCSTTSKPFTILSNSMTASGTKGRRRLQKDKFGSSGGASSSSGNSNGVSNNSSSAAPKSSQDLVSWSFDDDFFHQLQNQENSGSNHNTHRGTRQLLKAEEEEGSGENQASANPTYDFSMHSCSLSPSTHAYDDDDEGGEFDDGQQFQLNGRSLVTHKPRRLHKKILKTLRGGSGVKKSRKR